MKDTIRPVAIVFNVLLIGAAGLNVQSRGLPNADGEGLLVLLLFLAPISALVALASATRR